MRGVYRLTCDDPDLIYYGSSDDIYNRFAKHNRGYKLWKLDNNKLYCSSYKLYEVGYVEVDIILECPDGISKDEMREIEQTYIDNDECVNTNRAFRSKEQLKEYNRNQYRNNEKLKNYHKTDKQKEYKRQYYLKKKQIKEI